VKKINFTSRSYEKELLDRDDIPFEDIKRNMHELDVINTRLGGHAISIKGLRQLLGEETPVSICEIGCGGGDNLAALEKYCRKKKIAARFTGIDINPHCITFARQKPGNPPADWLISDYRSVTFEKEKPAILFSSLFCHHFTDEDLVAMLQWMQKNSGRGFFINDLHRHPLAFHSIRLLTKWFSRSYLVKNDAPLSVLRGFSRREWTDLLQRAGIRDYSIRWKWAFRWLLVVRVGPDHPL